MTLAGSPPIPTRHTGDISTQHSSTVWRLEDSKAVIADHDASGRDFEVSIITLRDALGVNVRRGLRVRFSVTARQAHSFKLMED